MLGLYVRVSLFFFLAGPRHVSAVTDVVGDDSHAALEDHDCLASASISDDKSLPPPVDEQFMQLRGDGDSLTSQYAACEDKCGNMCTAAKEAPEKPISVKSYKESKCRTCLAECEAEQTEMPHASADVSAATLRNATGKAKITAYRYEQIGDRLHRPGRSLLEEHADLPSASMAPVDDVDAAVDDGSAMDDHAGGVQVHPTVEETDDVEALDTDVDGNGDLQTVDDEVGELEHATVDETAEVESVDTDVDDGTRETMLVDEVSAQVHPLVDETADGDALDDNEAVALKDQSEDVPVKTTNGLDESDTAAADVDVAIAAEEVESEWTGSACCLCLKGPDDVKHIFSYSKSGTCSLCKHGMDKKKKALAGCIRGQPDYKSIPEQECVAECKQWADLELR